MPQHKGLYLQQWQACSRCGFIFPIGQLSMQKGMLLDAKCIDNLDVEFRPKVIAEVLADTQETQNEFENVQSDPQAIEFIWILLVLLPSILYGAISGGRL